MASTVIMLTNQNELNYIGSPAKGDGYYGFADGLHTASFHVRDFIGRIWLQASLVDDPTENDWFNIQLTVANPYYEFDGETTCVGTTFKGNFVWIRTVVDRSYLASTEYDIATHGILDKATLLI